MPALESFGKKFDPAQIEKSLKKWPQGFEKLYNSLDPLQKFDFRSKFRQLEAEIARIKKTFEEDGGEGQEAVIAAKQEKFLEDFRNRLLDKEKLLHL